ncbi:SCA7-domain-containing protein [Microthyrium microscopicum]|uniref:SCA7-domain-containing protein n=1 Tax=Microthyrium microscopicum TaxID=703497 RepID=A0A6A6UU22_9PEZI|nr:SCA7-domain-containing protein [Microthyrium microscopicum]
MAVTNGPPPSGNQSASRNTSTASTVIDRGVYTKLYPSEEKKQVKVVVKKKVQPSQTDAGNWQDSKASKPKPKSSNAQSKKSDARGPQTVINTIETRIAATYPSGLAFEEASDMIQCKHCKKPVYKSAAPEHIKDCLRKKQEKLQKKKEAKEAKDAALRKERNGGISPEPADDAGKVQSSAKKGAVDADGVTGAKKTSKKRKAEDDGKGPNAKKKKKDDPKPKTAKPKGPVDVEKQCGVLLPNGSMCARSLTCKSHSMGAKRAVPGRSMPYDVLLAQYQKKNQAKLQRAALDANAPLQDDFEPQGTVDSDEERDKIMDAINAYYREDPVTGARTMGSPLETWTSVPVRRRYNYIRLKGQIQQSIGGVHGNRLFAPSMNTGSYLGSAVDLPSATLESFDGSRRGSIRKASIG